MLVIHETSGRALPGQSKKVVQDKKDKKGRRSVENEKVFKDLELVGDMTEKNNRPRREAVMNIDDPMGGMTEQSKERARRDAGGTKTKHQAQHKKNEKLTLSLSVYLFFLHDIMSFS